MAKYPPEQVNTLPESVQDNFYSTEVNTRYAEDIFPLLGEDEELIEATKDLVMDVYFKALTARGFVSALVEVVKDEQVRKKITENILGYDFLPIADYLQEDILGLIEELGGDPLLYRQKVPVRDVVARIREQVDKPMEDERFDRRLDNILKSYIVNARTEEQARERLLGNKKTSGVGLDEDTAAEFLAYAGKERDTLHQRGIDVLPDEQYDREFAPEEGPGRAGAPEPSAEGPEPVEGEEPAAEAAEAIVPEEPEPASGPTEEEVHAAAEKIIAEPVQEPEEEKEPPELDTFVPEDSRDIQEEEEHLKEKVDVQQAGTVDMLEAGLAEEVVAIADVDLPDEDMKKRFLYAVKLFIRDIRDELETGSKFTMPVGSGGMGMSEPEAERVINLLKSKTAELQKFLEERAVKTKEEYVAAKADVHKKAAEESEKQEQEQRDKLFRELTAAAKVPPAKVQPAGDAAIQEPKPVPPAEPKVIPVVGLDEKLPTRGGVAPPLPPKKPVHEEKAPEAKAPAPSSEPPKDVKEEKPAVLESLAPAPEKAPEPDLSALAEGTAKKAPPPPGLPAVDEDLEPELAATEEEELAESAVGAVAQGMALPESVKEKFIVGPPPAEGGELVESAEGPAVDLERGRGVADLERSRKEPVALRIPQGDPELTERVEGIKPVAAEPPKPVQPAPLAAVKAPVAPAKPVVSDVKFAHKLTGPVEELQSITVKDFRRLSRAPKEATLKIKDKIDLLENQSFEMRTQGIKAWHESESNRTYLEMLRRSLEGVPILQVIAALQDENKPVLTREEFEAIMELNRDLRFG